MLCDSTATVTPAGFVQQYPQRGRMDIPISWWECRQCHGWFAFPVPSKEAIRRNWGTVVYADPACERKIADGKQHVTKRILSGLAARGPIGELLDVGCNTGLFMLAAQNAGYKVSGFDPNEAVVKVALQRNLDVRNVWHADECNYLSEEFQAVVANDVFCYSWHPFRDLNLYARLLRPGGVLAMRISNKRFVLGLVRHFTSGQKRDALLSRLLQGQFHTISLRGMTRVLKQAGFTRISFEPQAFTAEFSSATLKSRAAYLTADAILFATLRRINLSPGVLLFAQKAL